MTTRRRLLGYTAAGLAGGALTPALAPTTRAHAAPVVSRAEVDTWMADQVEFLLAQVVPSGALRGPTPDILSPTSPVGPPWGWRRPTPRRAGGRWATT
ncbi:hypothetical protein [Microlunatus sp. Y2014]|uniref:hypothetical protein n=1 Tax=Microlunatus sp. Y2014 TaxID=3418488 RepID=UPI003DA71277